MHTVAVNTLVLHRVKHFNAVTNQLHHVLVRTDNGAKSTSVAGLHGEGGDDIICLETLDLFAGDVERFGRGAGQRHLRAQIFWHRFSVGFVLVIHLVAKRVAAFVENHGHVGRRIRASVTFDITVQHVAKPGDGPDGHPIRFAGQRGQGVVGAEDKGRTIDQMKVGTFAKFGVAHGIVPPLVRCCLTYISHRTVHCNHAIGQMAFQTLPSNSFWMNLQSQYGHSTQPRSSGICNQTRGWPNAPSPPSQAMRNFSTIWISGACIKTGPWAGKSYAILMKQFMAILQADYV